MNDEVRAAAARLLVLDPLLIRAYGDDSDEREAEITSDILTVARYTLEAGQEVARLKETVENHICGICRNRVGYVPDNGRWEVYGTPCSTGGCAPLRAALSTPGGPESHERDERSAHCAACIDGWVRSHDHSCEIGDS